MPDSDLITVAAAAALLACSRAKVYSLHQAGVLELRKVGARGTRVVKASVERVLAEPGLMKSRPLPAPAARTTKPERLRTFEAAEYLGVSADVLFRMRKTGDGPPFIRVGKAVLYDRHELDAFVAARTYRSLAG